VPAVGSSSSSSSLRVDEQRVQPETAVEVRGAVSQHLRLPSNAREQYSSLPQAVLVDLLLARDDSIRQYREALYTVKRQKRSVEEALAKSTTPRDDNDDPNAEFAIERHGRKSGWLTKRSGLSLALRRNMTNVAAKDIGAILLDDISHQTVVRHELTASACLIASSRIFHRALDHEVSLRRLDNDADVCIVSMSWCCDATNSNMCHNQQSKVHNLRLTSAYQLSHSNCTSADQFFKRLPKPEIANAVCAGRVAG
jgi:hypothetical protein